ncbi:MAG: nucleotidyltransferase domain-containing protein [Rhodobacteraceae bacterium]|nr:nucleotidyltransferase domain-containing protein [Paracoccaceae bacterium]
MGHDDIIQMIKTALANEPRIRALFLSGSFGTGLADAYSDIDFILVSDEGATDEIARIWQGAIAKTGEIVLWWDRTPVPVLINAITADWTRTDVLILKPSQMSAQTQDALKPLIDHDGIYATLPKAVSEHQPNPEKLKRQIEDFIRILGLLHLAVGRKEYINGVLGIFHLRNYLVELMIEETNAPHRGGILHLNRLITQPQKDVLTALPAPVAEQAAMIEAHLAYAAAYLPRARRMAQQLGLDWPERFETVTWARLKKTLNVERPYIPTDTAL